MWGGGEGEEEWRVAYITIEIPNWFDPRISFSYWIFRDFIWIADGGLSAPHGRAGGRADGRADGRSDGRSAAGVRLTIRPCNYSFDSCLQSLLARPFFLYFFLSFFIIWLSYFPCSRAAARSFLQRGGWKRKEEGWEEEEEEEEKQLPIRGVKRIWKLLNIRRKDKEKEEEGGGGL